MRIDKEHNNLSMYTNIRFLPHIFSLDRHNGSVIQFISELNKKKAPFVVNPEVFFLRSHHAFPRIHRSKATMDSHACIYVKQSLQ